MQSLTAASDGAHDLPFEDVNATGATARAPYRRLLSEKDFFRRNLVVDSSASLALGAVRDQMTIPDIPRLS